jgi:hypothetical protein
MIHFGRSLVEIKNQEYLPSLKLGAALKSGTLAYPIYKRQLRYIPQDCNYITFSLLST